MKINIHHSRLYLTDDEHYSLMRLDELDDIVKKLRGKKVSDITDDEFKAIKEQVYLLNFLSHLEKENG